MERLKAAVIAVAPEPVTSPERVIVWFPESLPLKVVQSAAESTPAEDAEDVAEDIMGVVPPDEARG